MTKSHVNIPVDSIYELQRSLSGVEIAAYLTADPISEKKPSRLTDVAFHSVRPWLAAVDPKGTGVVWNYETRETVAEFSLGISSDAADGDGGDDEFGGSGTPTAKTLLQKTASPTTSYVKALRSKASSFAMLFYDHESIDWTTRSAEPRMFFEEWIVILTATHVVLCDLNQPTAIRSVSADELQRQAPCSIAILPSGLLAIGCQDGKIRLWSPRLWRVVDTIDTGSTKEVQQLLLLPLRGSAAATGPLDVVHFLTTVTVDGRVVTWKVSQSGECVKVPGVIELRDFYRAFDTGNGLSELRWHEHQEIVSGASKDGTVYFFDLTPLTKQSKQMTLMSILPTTKLPGASVLAGPRKGAFVVISLGASGSSVTISELVNKGRAVGRDNVPANYLEFAVGSSIESRDLRLPIGQAALKKFKMTSLCANPRDPEELCCVTSFGLFVLRATCLASSRPIMISRGTGKSPLVLYPGPCRITLRFYGEDTSSKQEDYKFQAAADAPNERLKTPSLLACPSDASFMSAVLPASTHVEVIQMDSELRNQKSINMHAVFSGNGIALAWHATKPRFAVLVPQDSNARRLTRAVSNVNAPKRRGFMFGGSTKGMGDDASAAAEARQRSSAARAMTLAMYDISAEGHVQSAAESCSCGDDRLLHVFSGPVLGVVKFEADGESGGLGGASTSFVGASELHDSPSMRNKRTESSMFSPTSGGSSASLSFADNDAGDLKKTTLEFFDWECGPSGGSLKRVGSGAIDAPLKIEWERATHRFCALVYPKALKIYRVTTSQVAEVVCLHEIPTPQTARSLKWMHHTLFFSTDDEIKCCVISKTRVFSFDIGSRLGFLEASNSSMGSVGDPSLQFPIAQKFVSDATTILDVCNQQLVLAAPVQSLHGLELSNRVLQCCILISIGQADLALQVAYTIPGELADWIASVFEAFAFVTPAMRLTKISFPCMINMAIKHNLLDDLERILQSPATLDRLPDSRDTAGTSLLQRACTCLHRGGRKEAVEKVCRLSASSGRSTNAIFLASLLNNDELFASALEAQDVWPGAFHSAKRGNLSAPSSAQNMLEKWNSQLHSATAPWKTVLSRNAIRAPENLTLTLSDCGAELFGPRPRAPAAVTSRTHKLKFDTKKRATRRDTMAPALGVFYGSQTGCAESIAKRIYDEALEKEIDAVFGPLNDLQNSELIQPSATPHHIVVVCSTTGNGDPPDNAAKFWRFIKRRTQPKDMLASVTYTVLGLGDTNYDKFCYMGKSLDKRMSEVGASRFFDMCAADEAMGLEEQVEPWLEGLWVAFAKSTGSSDDGNETASSSDGETSGAKAATTVEETPAPAYLQPGLATYDALFGPFSGPTDTPDDVPRLQSSLYSTRFVDAADATAPVAKPKPEGEDYSASHPFDATLQAAKYLTKSHSERKVMYVELDIKGSDIKFTPGDSIGIKCPNRAEDVDALLKTLELDGSALFCVEPAAATGAAAHRAAAKSTIVDRFPSPCSLRDVFLHYVDLLGSPKKAALRALAVHCTDEEEKNRMLVLSSKSGADKYKQFVTEQQLNFVDLLHLFPSCKPPLDVLLSLLPQLMPRFYSIATSPLADANTIGIAFTVVDDLVGPQNSIHRRGLCTYWFQEIAQPLLNGTGSVDVKIPLFLRPTRDFLLPASHEWPLLLIGPGTGVAPFMGFLQHRHLEVKNRVEVASQVCSGNWRGGLDLDMEEDEEFTTTPSQAIESKGNYLFFGCRRKADDWIFEEQMKEYVSNGTLRQLFTAFSREQEEKYYVQHDIRKQGTLVTELLLQSGGYVYVCGDGTQMAKDVHEALREVLEEHGKLSKEEADEKLAALAARQRYVRDIW